MIWWIVDRALLFYLLLGMLACGLAVCWWRSRSGKFLVATGVVTSLIAFLYLLTLFVVTDRQQLQLNIHAMAQGVLDGDPEAVFKHFAKKLRIGGHEGDFFVKSVEPRIRERGITELYLWDFDVEEVDRPGQKARLAFRVRGDSRWQPFTALCRAHFVLEGNDWKMQDLEFFNLFADTNTPIRIPLP